MTRPEAGKLPPFAIRHSSFEFLSSFVIRPSSFPRGRGAKILQLTPGIRPTFDYTMRYLRVGGPRCFGRLSALIPRRLMGCGLATTKWFSGNTGVYTHG